MALINCPECNHDVSDRAISCTNCGYKIKRNIFELIFKNKIALIIGVFIFIFIIYFSFLSSKPETEGLVWGMSMKAVEKMEKLPLISSEENVLIYRADDAGIEKAYLFRNNKLVSHALKPLEKSILVEDMLENLIMKYGNNFDIKSGFYLWELQNQIVLMTFDQDGYVMGIIEIDPESGLFPSEID